MSFAGKRRLSVQFSVWKSAAAGATKRSAEGAGGYWLSCVRGLRWLWCGGDLRGGASFGDDVGWRCDVWVLHAVGGGALAVAF